MKKSIVFFIILLFLLSACARPQRIIETSAASDTFTTTTVIESTPTVIEETTNAIPTPLPAQAAEQDVIAAILLLPEISPEALTTLFGDEPTITENYYTRHTFPNGAYFELDPDGGVVFVGYEDLEIQAESILKVPLTPTPEIGTIHAVLYCKDYAFTNLMLLSPDTRTCLADIQTPYGTVEDAIAVDIQNSGTQQLYLSGWSNDSTGINGIYDISTFTLDMLYDETSFLFSEKDIQAQIDDQVLTVTVPVADEMKPFQSLIPAKVFTYARESGETTILPEYFTTWKPVQSNDGWEIRVRTSIEMPALSYYWGPPEIDVEDNNMMYVDLARVDRLYALDTGSPILKNTDVSIKYAEQPETAALYDSSEGVLIPGVTLETDLETAYLALGGDKDSFVYSDAMTVDGVDLFEFCGQLNTIQVNTPKYPTQRGMRVGDTIEQVEKLYGKPDTGFSGDENVSYVCCDTENGGTFGYFGEGLSIHYQNGLVESFMLYRIILD